MGAIDSIKRFSLSPARLFFAISALLLVAMPILSFDYGVTWDEPERNAYGRAARLYYSTLGADQSYRMVGNTYQKGALFDLLATQAQDAFPGIDPYDVRHVVNSLFGWLLIVYAGLLARRFFGPWAGVLALLFCVLSPRLLGDSMNNSKDIPFAALMAAGLYYLSAMRRRFPYFKLRSDIVKLVAAAALCINVRDGGVLLIAYTGLLLAFFVLRDRESLRTLRRPALVLGAFLALAAVTAVLGTAFWPWAQSNPFVRLFQSIHISSRFPLHDKVLFAGRLLDSTTLPWYYVPFLFGVTLPLGVLGGLLASCLLLARAENRGKVLFLWFAILFPWGYTVAKHSVLYDGIRHFYFLYPPMVALAAGAWTAGIRLLRRPLPGRWRPVAAAAALGAAFFSPLQWELRFHPNETVYYNPLVGGVRGAYRRYTLDYWGNSYRQAVDYLHRMAEHRGEPIWFSANKGARLAELDARRYGNLGYVDKNASGYTYFLDLVYDWEPHEIDRAVTRPDVEYVVRAQRAPLCLVRRLSRPAQAGRFFSGGKARTDVGENAIETFAGRGRVGD